MSFEQEIKAALAAQGITANTPQAQRDMAILRHNQSQGRDPIMALFGNRGGGNSEAQPAATPTAAQRPQASVAPVASGETGAGSTGSVPIPMSAAEAVGYGSEAAIPTPTARPGEDANGSSTGIGLLPLLAGAIGAAGAYALYRRIAQGDQQAVKQAADIVGEQSNADARVAGAFEQTAPDPNMRALPAPDGGELTTLDDLQRPVQAAIAPEVVDADYEELPRQPAITEQRRIAGPESGMSAESIDDIIREALTAQPASRALPAPAAEAPSTGTARRRTPRVSSSTEQAPRPRAKTNAKSGRVKPRVKPRT